MKSIAIIIMLLGGLDSWSTVQEDAVIPKGYIVYEEEFKLGFPFGNRSIQSVVAFTEDQYIYSNTHHQSIKKCAHYHFKNKEIKRDVLYSPFWIKKDLQKNKTLMFRKVEDEHFSCIATKTKKKWEIDPNVKMIFNYPVQKATLQEESGITEAWFTPTIITKAGPAGYDDLPGLILKINRCAGAHTITIDAINLDEDQNLIIDMPPQAKEVSEERFATLGLEIQKRMRKKYPDSLTESESEYQTYIYIED